MAASPIWHRSSLPWSGSSDEADFFDEENVPTWSSDRKFPPLLEGIEV